MIDEQRETNGEESLAELLRLAGPRPRIADELKARVRASVQAEWQSEVAQRKRVRVIGASVLSAAAAITAILLLKPDPQPAAVSQPVEVARVQTVNGASTMTVGEVLMEGRTVETTAASTASIDWAGATLRLDRGTRLRIDTDKLATLHSGAVYFADNSERGGVEITTPLGVVRDIGTQFEVRLESDKLHVRVREGRVDLRRGSEVFEAPAGIELTATAKGVDSHPIPAESEQWAWIEHAAPPLVLEGMTLRDVVQHVASEKGLQLDLRRTEVAAKRLHGNVPLSPSEALDAATAAAGVRYRIENRRLVIQ
jgi:ferric-dicitrate binding protein FerR (iron transport regulator)